MTHPILEQAATAATYGGATSAAVFWGLHLSDIGVIVSVLVAVLGFAVNTWARVRSDRRERERHELLKEHMLGASPTIARTGRGDDSGC